MATELKEHTEDLAFERFKEALASDPGRYPRGAVFLAAEAPFARKSMWRNIREGRPVVLVFADGEERIVEASRPRLIRRRGPLGALAARLRSGSSATT